MRHSIYCNNMRKSPSNNNRSTLSRDRPNKATFSKGRKNNFSSSLEDNINEVLTLYEDSPSVYTEIMEKLEMYRINLTIAREFNSSKSERKLTAEFSNYIKKLKARKG